METVWISARAGAKVLGIHWAEFRYVADAAGVRCQQLPGRQRIRYHKDDVERVAAESVFTGPNGPRRAAVGAGVDVPKAPEEVATTPAKSAKVRPGPPRDTTKARAEEAP